MRIRLETAAQKHEEAFLSAVRASRALHRPWVSPPDTPSAFRSYVTGRANPRNMPYFAFSVSGELLAVVNISEIVRGAFQSAYLGYYVFHPHQRQGVMGVVLSQVIGLAFRKHRLHRLEANIQPDNTASVRLVRRLGFRKEGVSPRYLKIGGRWRDHERWAVTREDWTGDDRDAH